MFPNMAHIYRNGELTIVCDSQNVGTGIPGLSMSRPNSSPVLESGGFSLVCSPSTLPEALALSYWYKRAWTLQEMCFSRRILLFTQSQFFFHCSNSLLGEDLSRESTWQSENPNQMTGLITLDLCINPKTERRRGIPDSELELSDPEGAQPTELPSFKAYLRGYEVTKEEQFSKYRHLVEVYVPRSLTYENDILEGFAGVLEHFRETLGEHWWGLPAEIFGRAMLWHTNDYRQLQKRQNFPTWSWGPDGPLPQATF
jgi:hypothetical protein